MSLAGPPFVVYPLRFTPDPAAMIRFLVDLGMARAVTSPGDSFGELVAGGGGRVMVHRSEPDVHPRVVTDLCLSVAATEPAARLLEDHGLTVRVWDETYGKQGAVRGPGGEEIAINERQRDLYGYEAHDALRADPRLTVVAVRPSSEPARDAAFFGLLGFTPVGETTPWWQELHGVAGSGIIGLHPPGPGLPVPTEGPHGASVERVLGPPATVRLGFATTEPLPALADRLQDAGYDAAVREQAGVASVGVLDPDGCSIEIHPLCT